MFFTGTYESKVLRRSNHFSVVLPEKINKQTKSLILLHGFSYDENAWIQNTPLVQYAQTYNIAFLCPDAGISFYTDHATGENYGQAIGQEFIEKINNLLPLNLSRENTGIAGFSMGGYGAILLGLRYSEQYSWIGGFSPAFVFYKKTRNEPHFQQVFSNGDYGSENDPIVHYKKLVDRGQSIPTIILNCGTDDPLCEQTQLFFQDVVSINPEAAIQFHTQPGFHDFHLWKSDLENFIELFCNLNKVSDSN